MKNALVWLLRIVPAIIMLQTLYFKFLGAEESIYIFTLIGAEPWGRYGTGIAELIASVLLLIPAVSWLGSLAGVGLMGGAIFFHATKLGIEVEQDGGFLFILAMTALVACLINLWIEKKEIILFKKKLFYK